MNRVIYEFFIVKKGSNVYCLKLNNTAFLINRISHFKSYERLKFNRNTIFPSKVKKVVTKKGHLNKVIFCGWKLFT